MFSKLQERIRQYKLKKFIGEPPYGYKHLLKLDEKDYPVYLEKIFFLMTKEKLQLKNPKTFNQKIQWLKLYDSTPIKTQLTDKVLVRDWVSEILGGGNALILNQFCRFVLHLMK